jgi:outer membrane protein assembly factor BamE
VIWKILFNIKADNTMQFSRRFIQLIITAAFFISLAGCQHLPVGYDIEVQQGNIISEENVKELKIGMSREQVVEIMGEPVMVNTFDNRCWDYVYTDVSRKKRFVKNKVTLVFHQNRLVKILK